MRSHWTQKDVLINGVQLHYTRTGHKVRELNPNIAIVTLPDVGHLIRFDKTPVFMAALWAFLKQLPA